MDSSAASSSLPSPPISLPERIVVRSPNWLGDIIMALPMVHALAGHLREQYGERAHLAVAVPDKLADVWRCCPFIDEVVALEKPKKMFSVARTLKAGGFAGAVLLPNSLRSALECWLAKIPQIIGYGGHSRRWFLSHKVEPAPFDWFRQHHAEFYNDLARACGAEPASEPPLLDPARLDSAPPSDQPCTAPLVICAGAAYGPAKRWLPERFAEVAHGLTLADQTPILLLGAPGDAKASEAVRASLVALDSAIENRVTDRTGQTSLGEFMHLLAGARLVLCNDSGSMHLADALGVPTVAVFGSTEPRRTGPRGQRSRVARRHVICSPCFERTCPLGDLRCLKELEATAVLKTCRELWSADH